MLNCSTNWTSWGSTKPHSDGRCFMWQKHGPKPSVSTNFHIESEVPHPRLPSNQTPNFLGNPVIPHHKAKNSRTVRVDEIKCCFHLLDLSLSWHEANTTQKPSLKRRCSFGLCYEVTIYDTGLSKIKIEKCRHTYPATKLLTKYGIANT